MRDFLAAAGLVLVIEGVVWTLFPKAMKRAAAATANVDEATLRYGGLTLVIAGVIAVWLVRG